MNIIPAIDIIDGKCVRLSQGDFNRKTVYSDDPVEVAIKFEQSGISRLHLVDLDGARSGTIQNLSILRDICSATSLMVDFGGGVSRDPDVAGILEAGAEMVTVGTIAVRNPLLLKSWISNYGTDKFFIGADISDEQVMIRGWQEKAELHINDFLWEMYDIGATRFFCTDISKDGMMSGPAVKLYEKLIKDFPGIDLTASGGVRHRNDLIELAYTGCSGAIIGKAFYENGLSNFDLQTQ